MKVGIVGNGYVGQSTMFMLSEKTDVLVYDIIPEKCIPVGINLSDLSDCDVVFVCLPTPMNKDGSCHTSIVEDMVKSLRSSGVSRIVVRSTTPVGFCEGIECCFMPEFITEMNWRQDIRNSTDWIVGTLGENRNSQEVDAIKYILSESKGEGKISDDKVHISSTSSAEISKLVRNSFLATKVSFFNEVDTLCQKVGINYNMVMDLCVLDKRVGSSHMMVPGPDGKRGFGGTCFVKDISSIRDTYSKNNVKCPIMDAASWRNNNIDRSDHDWEDLKGRAVI